MADIGLLPRSPGQVLRPFAVTALNTRGRRADAGPSHDRSPFRRDYARLVHSRWFRAMQGKELLPGLVSVAPRTLATHAVEVEQVVRSVCNRLRLNEDLAAAMAIASNLGAAPCGTAGAEVLTRLAAAHGGVFVPGQQALRMVDVLDDSYVEHAGLNLLHETREFLARKNSAGHRRALRQGEAAEFEVRGSLPLEAQVVLAVEPVIAALDSVAGLIEAGAVSESEVIIQPVLAQAHAALLAIPKFRDIARRSSRLPPAQVLRMAFSNAIADIVATTAVAIERAGIATLDDVRAARPLAGQSDATASHYATLAAALQAWRARAAPPADVVEQGLSGLFARTLDSRMQSDEACRRAVDAVVMASDSAIVGEPRQACQPRYRGETP